MKKLYDLFLFTSIYIAVCAVIMGASAFILFDLQINYYLLFFLFAGTLCSYNFHWLLTPAAYSDSYKSNWSHRNRRIHLILFIVCGLFAALAFVKLFEYTHWLLLAVFITFLYSAPKIPLRIFNALRRIAIGKTVFLAFAWTYIPFILPMLVSGASFNFPQMVFVLNRFFLIYAICILFDFRDREKDRQQNIRSVVTEFPEHSIAVLYYGSLAVFAITLLLLLPYLDIFQIAALLVPGLILLFSYTYARKNHSDHYYYFILDGLMMLSSLFILLQFIIHL